MSAPGRWLRTVAHVSAPQIWHRGRLALRRAWWERRSARMDAGYRRRAAGLAAARFEHPGLAQVVALREALRPGRDARQVAEDALTGRFRFLNRTLDLGREVAWHRADLDQGTRLWKTLLHEFGYAEDLALSFRETGDPRYRERVFDLVTSWRRASPIGRPGFALDAWNARAVANRLIHLAVAGSVLGLRPGEPDAEGLGREIALHGLFLRDNLELDLRGNHLLRDAVGLVFAHELCGGIPDARDWLERQLAEQVLADGCHVERAPMYHALALRDALEARTLLAPDAPRWLDEAVLRLAGFLEAICLGDGEIPLLGDGWLGEADTQALLAAVRERVGPPSGVDAGSASGLVPLHAGAWRSVLRAGPHGPDYQLGHAHADLLSFDLSVRDRRVVTDTGTSRYDAGPERQQLRSTAAHNTVQIDGEEQIEAWGSFRTGRRGQAALSARGETGGWRWAAAVHDAWRHRPGRPRHHRLLAVSDAGVLVVDAVTGRGRHRIASRLHLHPGRPDAVRVLALGPAAERREAPLHERFGETQTMTEIAVEQDADLPWLGGWWIGVAPGDPPDCTLHLRGSVVELRCRAGATPSLDWDLAAVSPDAALVLRPAGGPSATKSEP